jgi:uracil DNA glycosylase
MFDQLINTGWSEKLRFFIKSHEFEDLLLELREEVRDGYRFTPSVADVLKPFQFCKYKDVKLVILTPEPFTNPILNTGFGRISSDPKHHENRLFCDMVGIDNISTTVVAKQGVLFLNASLTTRIGIPGKHHKIWQDFLLTVIDVLNRKTDLAWLIIGSDEHLELINPHHFITFLPQLVPVKSVGYDNPMTQIDEYLVDKNLESIIW